MRKGAAEVGLHVSGERGNYVGTAESIGAAGAIDPAARGHKIAETRRLGDDDSVLVIEPLPHPRFASPSARAEVWIPRPMLPEIPRDPSEPVIYHSDGPVVTIAGGGPSDSYRPTLPAWKGKHALPPAALALGLTGRGIHQPTSIDAALRTLGLQRQAGVRKQLNLYLSLYGQEPLHRPIVWQTLGPKARAFVRSLQAAAAVDICGAPIAAIARRQYLGVPPSESNADPRSAEYDWKKATNQAARHVNLGRARAAALGYWPWAFASDPLDPWQPDDRQAAAAGHWHRAFSLDSPARPGRQQVLDALTSWAGVAEPTASTLGRVVAEHQHALWSDVQCGTYEPPPPG